MNVSLTIEDKRQTVERRTTESVEPGKTKRDFAMITFALEGEKLEEEPKYHQEHARLQSFKNWPKICPVEVQDLAKAGFYYLNKDDSVQCFTCLGQIGKWKPLDSPAVLHKAYFPTCPFVQVLELKHIEMYSRPVPTLDQLRAGQFLQRQRTLRAQMGPLNNCRYPDFVQENARLGTFNTWPGNPGIGVTPRTLAKAGFYFTKLSDECNCFYCGGGLKDWESTDEPWTEHARWFPKCEWLIQQRGHFFIAHVQQVKPPPAIRTPDIHFKTTNLTTGETYQVSPPPHSFHASYRKRNCHASSTPSPPLQSSKNEMTFGEEKGAGLREYECRPKEPEAVADMNLRPKPNKLEITETTEPCVPGAEFSNATSFINDFMDSPSTQLVVEMGYHIDLIRYVAMKHFKKTGRGFSSTDELLKSIWEAQGQCVDPTPSVDMASRGHDVKYLNKLPKELKSEGTLTMPSNDVGLMTKNMEALTVYNEPRLCKICMDNELSTLFMPCKHLATCSECSDMVTECPMCRQPISDYLTVFI